MTVRTRTPQARRGGVTAVECALLLGIFLLFLFGIFEYSRFLLMLHVTQNATRDGARYAVVNVDKPSNFDTTTYVSGTVSKVSIKQYVNDKMAGVQGMITGYTVSVFPCDPAKLAQTPPVVASKVGPPSPMPWNQATFTEKIGVRVQGKYKPALPSFLHMGNEIDVDIVSVMGSEG